MKGKVLLCVSVVMILLGGFFADRVQTNFGNVTVRDVRFVGSGGRVMSAYLFIPKNATAKTPAPAIMATHGYINSRETQSAFAIEYARRGWVVLTMDQSGHGYSDAPAFASGYGGADGLAFLRSLDIVDNTKIGLEGHSMGGWASVTAAAMIPDGYASIVLEGSSAGTVSEGMQLAPDGTADFPRNMALVFSKHDEFSQLMWETPVASDVVHSAKLKTIFATTDSVKPGVLYGAIENGNARILYQPDTTHPGDHFSNEAIGYSIDWFQKTLGAVIDIPVSNQIWFWKEVGTLIAFLGGILLVFASGRMLLNTPFFAMLKGGPENVQSAERGSWWFAAVMAVLVPCITYVPFMAMGYNSLISWLFPQNITNCIMVWVLANAVILLILFTLWHLFSNKKKGANLVSYGLGSVKGLELKKIGLSALFAITVSAILYTSLVLTMSFFKVDYRFWIIALKPLSTVQFTIVLRYILPFMLYFVVSAVALNGQLRLKTGSMAKRMISAGIISVLGFIIFLAAMYIPLLSGGSLLLPPAALFCIVAIQFLPIFIITGCITTYFFEKTGQIWTGAFINSVFIVWYVVAGQATHFPLF